jgi:hypothetical protein
MYMDESAQADHGSPKPVCGGRDYARIGALDKIVDC